jgi:hypothetical protein
LDSYKVQLFLHVTAVVVAIGPTFAYPFLQAFAERSGAGATRFVMNFMLRMEMLLLLPGSVLLFLFGMGLIFDDHTGYKDDFPTWLMIAMPLFLLVVLVEFAVQRPALRSAARALEGAPNDAPPPAAYEPIGKRLQMVGGLQGLAIVIIILLMTWKPWE